MRLVILESPYSGDVDGNVAYARKALLDSLSRGEAPFASHLLYTQVLDDTAATQRQQGILAGMEWATVASMTVVYVDLGISAGMEFGINDALRAGRPVEYRTMA